MFPPAYFFFRLARKIFRLAGGKIFLAVSSEESDDSEARFLAQNAAAQCRIL